MQCITIQKAQRILLLLRGRNVLFPENSVLRLQDWLSQFEDHSCKTDFIPQIYFSEYDNIMTAAMAVTDPRRCAD